LLGPQINIMRFDPDQTIIYDPQSMDVQYTNLAYVYYGKNAYNNLIFMYYKNI